MERRFVKVEKGLGPQGRIAVVRFGRGDNINTLSQEAMRELRDVPRDFEDDLLTSVVILTGSAKAFSAGFDLKDTEGRQRDQLSVGERIHRQRLGPKMCKAWHEMDQVTIVAIEGHCIGGGAALVVSLDFRTCGKSAHFRIPEVELGIPTRELIYGLAGGPAEGHEVKAFYPGGSSSPVLTAQEGLDLPYSFEAMAAAGSMLGSGSIIVADRVSIPHMALRTARFYHHESCGKCTPCREGTNWTVKMLERVVRGEATPMDLDIVASVQENIIGHCLCVLGDSMAMPVGAMVRKFRDEFEQVIAEAGSPLEDNRIAAVQGIPETLGAAT